MLNYCLVLVTEVLGTKEQSLCLLLPPYPLIQEFGILCHFQSSHEPHRLSQTQG